jgi:U3 small nucleolar RNA-associated protein 22
MRTLTLPAMQKRAVKRRKLGHDSSDDSGLNSQDPRSESTPNGSIESGKEKGSSAGSSSEDEAQLYFENDSSNSDDGYESEEEEEQEDSAGEEREDAGEAHDESIKHSRSSRRVNGDDGRSTLQQDSVYTGEIYKSNVFKLQVDQLLKQVRPKYGKFEPEVSAALHTLKRIIEQIPNQEPMAVRTKPIPICTQFG